MRRFRMKRAAEAVLLAAAWMTIAGCTSYYYTGVAPVNPQFDQTVAELQPTLTWAADPRPSVRYDLIIYAPMPRQDLTLFKVERKSIYYREGIAGTNHTVEIKLQPGAEYTWAIRRRTALGVSEWSQHQRASKLTSRKKVELLRFSTPPAP